MHIIIELGPCKLAHLFSWSLNKMHWMELSLIPILLAIFTWLIRQHDLTTHIYPQDWVTTYLDTEFPLITHKVNV